ncbi:MmgE/PrpD family protein [Vineibacter terrae]|uniref:MmgE/PrpD family protein n=1 Tax=Vineibacter terrae TaxID=2586908 RepID=A0A5C8PA33_9HYPH|nr:MmgE/PrpD family protein [Vineibacter terrae]TXL70632.1 MmgE/PrpD family protein [Vineibacter terrae]
MQAVKQSAAAPAGPTEALVRWARAVRFDDLDPQVRHAAVRHAIDTIGVIAAGSQSSLTCQVGALMREEAGGVPVPGFGKRLDPLDACYLAGCAAHGLELDDGYRQGSIHPGVAVLPPAIAACGGSRIHGRQFLRAVVVGYEAITSIARVSHPDLRQRGFHPTGVVGVLGAALTAATLWDLEPDETVKALGIAASSAAGLFAFVAGGADVKRLHAAHAAREGGWAAMLARQGVSGPPAVIEGPDGFLQAFPGRPDAAAGLTFAADGAFGITDCYVKPHPCCRHLQPALEALIELVERHAIAAEDVERIDVETYSIAASHAGTPWHDMASAQLSFPFILLLGLRYRDVSLRHFEPGILADAAFARLAGLVHITSSPQMDGLYPQQRPARVTIRAKGMSVEMFKPEALGSRQLPLSDTGLSEKFLGLVAPVCGDAVARQVLDELWHLPAAPDVGAILRRLAPR